MWRVGELMSLPSRHYLDPADNEPMVFIDGRDDAVLGLTVVECEHRVAYNHRFTVRGLMCRDGMDEEGAVEFVDYSNEASKILPSPPINIRTC